MKGVRTTLQELLNSDFENSVKIWAKISQIEAKVNRFSKLHENITKCILAFKDKCPRPNLKSYRTGILIRLFYSISWLRRVPI